MSSSFRTLRALLVAISSCSLAFSLPSSSSALSKRSFGDYIDNLIYLDGNKTSLYSAVSFGEQTYAAVLDNKWDGLLLHGANVTGNSSTSHSITIDAFSVQVTDGRGEIGFLKDDITIEYFDVPQWPSTLPTIGVSDIGNAYVGLDINNGMSPIYYYFDARWPEDYSKWYYDVVITYDWDDATANSTGVDFAGVVVAGQTLSWEDLLGISSSDVQKYGLPDTNGINSQPEIYLTTDGTFYLDNTFTVNNKSTSFTSTVPKTQSGKVVADIYFTKRWSMFPDDIVKAIYGSLSSAKYTPDSTFGFWTIPCDSQVSFSFSIDGKTYDVDPAALIAPNPWGDQCIGSIFTKGQAVAAVPEFDIILGFQFTSAFYLRAGINHDTNKPYYKMLPMQSPSGGWDSGVSAVVSSLGYSTPASGATSTAYSSATGVTSAPYTYATGSGSVAYTYASDPSSTASYTYGADPSSTASYTYGADPSSSASYTYGADPSGTAAVKAAGNLAETDDDDLNSQVDFYKNKAKTYEIVVFALAGALGLGIIAAIIAVIVARRSSKASAQPSAYRTIHEAEFSEPKAALYDAEGGHSRYSDPYHDTHPSWDHQQYISGLDEHGWFVLPITARQHLRLDDSTTIRVDAWLVLSMSASGMSTSRHPLESPEATEGIPVSSPATVSVSGTKMSSPSEGATLAASSSNPTTTSSSSNSEPTPSYSEPQTASSSKEYAVPSSAKRTPPSGPRLLARTGLVTALLSSHLRKVPLRNSTNATTVAPPSGLGSTKPSSTSLAKPVPNTVVTAKSPALIIKREDLEGVPPPLCGKRPRVADPSAYMDEAPFKRVKTEENDVTRELLKLATDRDEESSLTTDGDADPSCAVQAIYERAGGKSVLAPAGRSSSARRRRKNAVGRFLARLPVPLDHHSSLFVSLGIRNMSYIRSVASMPQHVLNELMYALQGQGLSFVEALVLRDALDELPVDRNSPRHRPRSTEGGPAVGVDVFLDSLRPSMKHHASTFRKLGLYTSAHMSALGKTKARYAKVETTLRSKGLSWMDCFIVRMAVQVQARRP